VASQQNLTAKNRLATDDNWNYSPRKIRVSFAWVATPCLVKGSDLLVQNIYNDRRGSAKYFPTKTRTWE
jgi:hypothetical protein